MLLVIALLVTVAPARADNATLFYDSFQGSLSPAWSSPQNNCGAGCGLSPLRIFTNGGGSLSIVAPGSLSIGGIVANQSDPVIPSNIPDGSLVDIIFSASLLNVTPSVANGVGLGAHFQMGLITANGLFLGCTGSCGGVTLFPPPGNLTAFEIDAIQRSGATQPAYQYEDFGDIFLKGTAGTKQVQALYSNTTATPDPTVPHLYEITLKWWKATGLSWIAFSIDRMALLNVTQQACSCLGGGSLGLQNLYPYYYIGTSSTTGNPIGFSIMTVISYVWATNYVPAAPPRGFFPSTPCAQTPLNPNGACAGQINQGQSIDQTFQNEAVAVGGGNIYFGGTFLTMIFLSIFELPLAFFVTRNVFIHSFISVFGISFMVTMSVLPLWALVVPVIIGAGIVYHVIPGRMGGSLEEGKVGT